MPVKFNIDLAELEKKYFAFQKQFHPDSAGIAEIENSIAINSAYEILSNPLRRAAYILQLNNIDVETDGATKPDLATLEEVLEIQEKIATLDEGEILSLKKELNSQIKSLIEDVVFNLDNGHFTKAAQIIIKAKYFDKILRDLKNNLK